MSKYYIDKVLTDIRVSWECRDANGKVLSGGTEQQCFSLITYGKIEEHVKSIHPFKALDKIPYSKDNISRWIEELNDLGFPCEVSFAAGIAHFTISLDQYKYKMHICCTLQLIRCLHESRICKVPELYFEIIDKDSECDRFDELQNAHKKACDVALGGYPPNMNHMITYRNNGNNVSRETLFNRIEATGHGIYSAKRESLDALWRGL